jgi:hypothetical protein
VKKIVSILLIFLLLFNALGFYGLFIGLRYKSKLDLVQRLDKQQYSEDETITLKIPIAIPYQMGTEYERIDGEIEHHGEFYRMVKQKLESDTLYVVCIKDHESKRIKQALTDYVKTFTDEPVDAKHNGKNFTSFIKDFLPTSIQITEVSFGWNHTVDVNTSFKFFYDRSIVIFSPPPQS